MGKRYTARCTGVVALLFSICFAPSALAQNKAFVQGQVVDETERPMAFVNVQIIDTTDGAVTGHDGALPFPLSILAHAT